MIVHSYKPYPTAVLNPRADPIFKSLFTTNSQDSHGALTCFLSDLVGKTVSDVVLQPNELPQESTSDKQAEFDITCKIDNEVANIEMQGRNINDNYGKRTEYHLAHVLNHYTTKGDPWEITPKVYQISVLNFVFDKEEKNCFNHYVLRNEHGRTVSETLNVLFLELPKVLPLNDDIKTLTPVEMWGKFFIYANNPEKKDFIEELSKANRGIHMAVRVLHSMSQDELNWYRESSYWMRVSDDKTMKNAAERKGLEKGFKKGLKQGREVGRKQGLQEGRQEGRQEGLQEGRKEGLQEGIQTKAIDAAIEFLKAKVDPEIIAKCVKLPLEQVLELQKQQKN